MFKKTDKASKECTEKINVISVFALHSIISFGSDLIWRELRKPRVHDNQLFFLPTSSSGYTRSPLSIWSQTFFPINPPPTLTICSNTGTPTNNLNSTAVPSPSEPHLL
ncbi:hypothetical protein CHARACLAT_021662 [Characodon lateralis]|uniref:Uncharacterized protein n=1 Tax=Characodon lateralis TaxID=208331 RepID=A0ABU7DIN3_9TELE|nr:hypothetical protein [Characodon lateralis]